MNSTTNFSEQERRERLAAERREAKTRHSTLYDVRTTGEDRTISAVASTNAIDSYGEIVDNHSWRLDRYLKNPIVLFAHNSRALPIGYAKTVTANDGALRVVIKFATAAANPMAEQVWQLLQEGMIKGISVGFVPGSVVSEKRDGKDVFVLKDCELHEISVVPVPANPEALVGRSSSGTPAPRPTAPASADDARAAAYREAGLAHQRRVQETVDAMPKPTSANPHATHGGVELGRLIEDETRSGDAPHTGSGAELANLIEAERVRGDAEESTDAA